MTTMWGVKAALGEECLVHSSVMKLPTTDKKINPVNDNTELSNLIMTVMKQIWTLNWINKKETATLSIVCGVCDYNQTSQAADWKSVR
jgi:hypothetical protein